jgi:integrase
MSSGLKGRSEVELQLSQRRSLSRRARALSRAPEFNFAEAEWRIPAERMKRRQMLIVPLSTQVIAILRELEPLTGGGKYVFPCERTRERPMSENTVNAGLRRMGYTNDEMTGHGFRSMASTLLNEQRWPPDAIERQLAHAEENETRGAYNYAEHLPERRRMMQSWADYLSDLARKLEAAPLALIAEVSSVTTR